MENKLHKKIIAVGILCTFLITVFFPLAQSQPDTQQTTPSFDNLNWWNTQWPYRKLITIDDDLVSEDLLNFPVLISELTDSDLAAAAQANGQDIVFIRFTDNATILNHEVEFYNHLTGQLLAWVKLPLLSNDGDTKLWMYYGNPNAGDQQHVEATWDAGFLAVHHLQETTGTAFDSTAHNNDGTPYGAPIQDILGKIDGADFFDGVDDRLILPSVYTTETQFTMETWIFAEPGARHFISQRNDASQGVFLQVTSDNSLQYYINGISHITGLAMNTWTYVALIYNGVNADLYVNSFDSSIPCTAPTWPAVALSLGNRPAGDRAFHGTMDEVRFSNVARTSGWITTAYTNQNNPTEFILISPEDSYEYTLALFTTPPAAGTISAVPSPPYYYNTLVTLTAIPNSGYQFDHWSGDLSGTTNPQNLLIDGDKTVTATFTSENTPPIARDDHATVQENSTDNQIDVLANDSDPDGDTITIISITQPTFGTSSYDSSFTYYTPDKGYDGPDAFTYKIDDGNGGTATATVFITVIPINETNNPPNIPSQPVPDDQETNVSITTNLWWIGGDPDQGDSVTYDVYFGTTTNPPKLSSNQTASTYDIPVLSNGTKYYWRIVSWDNHKTSTPGPLWSFTTEQEEEPPQTSINVTISRPLENSFYLRNFRLLRHTRNTIVYGPIIIRAEAIATNTSVTKVEFYIDNKLKKSDDTAPYTYRWAPLRSFKHTIQVKAYAASGQIATDDVTVFKWRLHPILLLGGAYVLSELMT